MNPEEHEVELVHGMRGGIPSARMEQIHLALPYSLPLRDTLPILADPFAAPLVGIRKMRARVRLSDGWHMLNQARQALIEAEACTVFYEEIQSKHTESLYYCRYYLDDAALRLYSSCEHILQFVALHWNLSIHKKMPSANATPYSEESRDGSLVLVLKAAEQFKDRLVHTEVAKLLRTLRSSRAWKTCVKHRNDWVHSRIPATSGLFPSIMFETVEYGKAFPSEILKLLGRKEGQKCERMSFGEGSDICVLREAVRSAYCELFGMYEGFAKLLAKENETTENDEKERVR
jgi:hypothetical protein